MQLHTEEANTHYQFTRRIFSQSKTNKNAPFVNISDGNTAYIETSHEIFLIDGQ
jgi:hypothetical protein